MAFGQQESQLSQLRGNYHINCAEHRHQLSGRLDRRWLSVNRSGPAFLNQIWALDTTYIPMAKGFDYFDCYNTNRPHSKLEWLTPQEKYVATLPKLRLTA